MRQNEKNRPCKRAFTNKKADPQLTRSRSYIKVKEQTTAQIQTREPITDSLFSRTYTISINSTNGGSNKDAVVYVQSVYVTSVALIQAKYFPDLRQVNQPA